MIFIPIRRTVLAETARSGCKNNAIQAAGEAKAEKLALVLTMGHEDQYQLYIPANCYNRHRLHPLRHQMNLVD